LVLFSPIARANLQVDGCFRNLELPDPSKANFALRSEEVAEGVVYQLAGETLGKVGETSNIPMKRIQEEEFNDD
jgi:hypothetical protein